MDKVAVEVWLKSLGLAETVHTEGTPRRVEKLWKEVLWGLHSEKPVMTAFDNYDKIDQLMTIGPISIRSCCAHHLVPVIGSCWVGYVPQDSLLGLSKFHRLAQWCFARPTVQEQATKHLADELEQLLKPAALGVVVRADHFCVKWRGVQGDGTFVTSDLRGVFMESPARSEFMQIIKGQGF